MVIMIAGLKEELGKCVKGQSKTITEVSLRALLKVTNQNESQKNLFFIHSVQTYSTRFKRLHASCSVKLG